MIKKIGLTILKWGSLLGIAMAALLRLKVYANHLDMYSVKGIFDLLHVLLFIGALYLCIKEVRDILPDGKIAFSKAFGIGSGVSILAFFIVLGYLYLYYDIIDKTALPELNARNYQLYTNKIAKDTISPTPTITTDTTGNTTIETSTGEKIRIPHYDNALEAALNYSFRDVLLLCMLFNIFVSAYLYRRKSIEITKQEDAPE
ncbi:MAG: DUF4199 domain-containing protein [Bacteroidales bacterium]|jgi:hypothetical protein|nr:DUF4199 domain-containing protein [Bacteroidales bacterium]